MMNKKNNFFSTGKTELIKQFLILLLVFTPMLISAQDNSIGITGGYTTNGFGVQASFNLAINDNSYIQFGGYFSKAEDNAGDLVIPYNDATFNVGYFHNVISSLEGKFNIAIGAGPIVGYEIVNNGKSEFSSGAEIDGENQIIYGAYAGLDMRIYISDKISIAVIVNQYYHEGSDLGRLAIYSGLGFRYHIF